jgi:hypothetical protein
MRSVKPIPGRMLQHETPNWRPLENLAPDDLEDFMWMHEVELDGGARLQAYKHYWTRRYLHLDGEGRAFVFLDNGAYRQVAPCWLLELVLRDVEELRPG